VELADRYAAALGPAPLIVVRGLMGSGKSTVARALAERIGAEYLSTDEVRRERFGASDTPAEFGGGNYTPDKRQRVYDELWSRAAERLAAGLAVVLDGTFLAGADQRRAVEVATARKLPVLLVNCTCPPEVAKERITRRLAFGGDASEARPELFDAQQARDEPTPAELPAISIDTVLPLETNLDRVLAELGSHAPRR
jgi:predicted kinase